MNATPYRRLAEVERDPEPAKKRSESPLVRLGLLLVALFGPVACYGWLSAVVTVQVTVVGVASIIWVLSAYLIFLIGGPEIVSGSGKKTRRLRLLGLAWAPFFLPGLVAWNVGRWVLRGEEDA